MRRYAPLIIILTIFVLALAGAWGLLINNKKSVRADAVAPQPRATINPTNTNRASSNPYLSTAGAEPPHAKGATDAKVVLEEFGDLQCPPCARLHQDLKQIPDVQTGKVRFIFRHLPLVNAHPNAMDAARATEAAAIQGKFWEMQDYIYTNQAAWSATANARPMFESYARTLGLNVERFTRDFNSPQVEDRIKRDIARAVALGVESTPTVYLNNREIPYAEVTVDNLKRLLTQAQTSAGNNSTNK